MNEITLKAPAKLNLYLDITGKREDGYHLLETVMTSVDLCDKITIKRAYGQAEKIVVGCTNAEIPQNEGNICYKAARLFLSEANIRDSIEIFIEKHIPHGAGLGGGSANAATVFRGLNELYGYPLEKDELLKLGNMAGADVPFCIVGGTKLCRGTGEIISECPALKKQAFLIIMPNFGCDTKAAYKKYDEAPVKPKDALDEFFKDYPRYLYNVFEELYRSDDIREIKEALIKNGAKSASLTGSGAAVFGIFENREKAEYAKDAFSASGLFTAVVENIIP
ncbi:MAG: 4-(cytidine 5'-diphospho)-2-C-methyl-D-erythritol kinase [Oscillospiraceae bacterium]|nr:4-(cytidine 5'-diphospho)-2-C-methyl-D-erythritol kinase [Oscillospiraceae bacterium]